MVKSAFIALLAACLSVGGSAFAEAAPKRVVSVNLCTDQLAMLLAAPGQLISVTYLASDPTASVMVEEAKDYPANHGLAEEIYLLDPDLVLAGQFTARATVSMLRRLGIEVIEFAPAYALNDVSTNLLKMGEALGQQNRARQQIDVFEQRLSDTLPPEGPRPTAATYAANGYSSGTQSLTGEIIETAGFHTLATELGLPQGGFLPLEALIMADPDLVISGKDRPGTSRAEEILHHPALAHLTGGHMALQDRGWICGLPAVLDAVEKLRDERDRLETK